MNGPSTNGGNGRDACDRFAVGDVAAIREVLNRTVVRPAAATYDDIDQRDETKRPPGRGPRDRRKTIQMGRPLGPPHVRYFPETTWQKGRQDG
jgi:hypothetical protein